MVNRINRVLLVMALVAILLGSSSQMLAQPRFHDIRPGYGVSEMGWLSDYLPKLKGTPGDTRVYVLEGKRPGGKLLIVGGTHEDEIAGIMAATWMVENLEVEAGTVIVIARANNSASTHHANNRPEAITLETTQGERRFVYGYRLTNPAHQKADPEQYLHPQGGEFKGEEARNLNRVHPGDANGTLTEQISFAIVELIRREGVNVAFDLHEAGPTSRLANMLISHPKSIDLAAEAVFSLELEKGISMKLEVSSPEFRGLSHREWGDHTEVASFLIETPNPGQDRKNDDVDIVNGPTNPLSRRVATHLQTIESVITTWNMANPESNIEFDSVPTLDDFAAQPLGYFLND